MGATTEIAKRLSFGDLSLHTPEVLDVPELLTAFRDPSTENFQRALEQLHTINGNRFDKMLQVSQRQAESGNESDLQRLSKQLSMVKNNFQTYDVQEEFMTALLQGKFSDDGASGDVRAVGNALKQQKEFNESMRESILESIAALVEANKEIHEKYDAVKQEIHSLEKEAAAHRQCKDAQETSVQSSQLASLAAEAKSLEKMCVEHEALATELESAIASELDEMEALHAEVTSLEEANARQTIDHGSDRFSVASEWCKELELLFGRLTGVEILAIDVAALQLRLTTHVKDTRGVTHTYAHTLAVSLEQSSSKICSIELTPSDITLSDIQATVQTQQAPLAIVVQQVHARIGAQKRRGFELEDARNSFSVAEVGEDCTLIRCQLADTAAELEVRLPLSWPAPGVSAELTDLQAVSGVDLKPILKQAVASGCCNNSLLNMLNQVEAQVVEQLQATSQGL